MAQEFKHRQIPAGNPLANVLVVVVGAIVIGVSIVLGVVAFIALAAALLVMAAVIGIRVWWLKRRFGRRMPGDGRPQSEPGASRSVIEGEYRVVERDGDPESLDRT